MNMIITILVLLLVFSLCAACCSKFYVGAGYKRSDAFIPFYNLYVLSRIIGWDKWWCYVLLLFPYFNTFMAFLMFIELAKCYNRFAFWEIVCAGFFPFIYFPLLSRQNVEYHDPKTTVRPPKGWVRDWLDAILWAVLAALIIRTFVFEMYTIPSSSMEGTLMTGDYLVVSKIGYGPRFPNTPLAFPFVHHTLPWTKTTKSYIEWPKIGYWRLPGFSSIKRNDPIVFNLPAGDTVSEEYQSNRTYYQLVREYGRERVYNDKQKFGRIITRPVDKRENYVKRLIALPGDTLQIIDGVVYINGEMGYQPPCMQHNYLVKLTGNNLSAKTLEKFNIYEGYRTYAPDEFILNMNAATAEKFGQQQFVKEVTKMIAQADTDISQEIFPNDTLHFKWNVDNYGPIVIPKEGTTVKINPENIALYDRCITAYEHNSMEIKDNKIFINGKEAEEYTFKMDYYWMMGDNRHNSQDSRFWGYVPVDHIVGKPLMIWFSKDNTYHKIRWNRFFKFPK
mgnify:CR=1 FL=1